MKIERPRLPSANQLIANVTGTAICFWVMMATGYPMEQWPGVVMLFVVALYVSQLVVGLLINLVLSWFLPSAAKTAERFERVHKKQRITKGKGFGTLLAIIAWALSVLATIVGATMAIVGLLVNVAGLTDFGPAFISLTVGLLVFGMVVQLSSYLFLLVVLRMVDSLTDKRLAELLKAGHRRRRKAARPVGLRRVRVALVLAYSAWTTPKYLRPA